MINAADYKDDIDEATLIALIDFFANTCDALDGGSITELRTYYSNAIRDKKHPLSILYGVLLGE
jgi:hypothetical protein